MICYTYEITVPFEGIEANITLVTAYTEVATAHIEAEACYSEDEISHTECAKS